MTLSQARIKDRKFAIVSSGIFLLVVLASLLSGLSSSSNHKHQDVSNDRLFSGLTVTPKRITVQTAEQTYELYFDGQNWTLPTKAYFPANTDKVVQLLNALQTARFDRARTSLESRHAQLGLADPRQEGNGALIALPDTSLRPVIIGRRNQTDYGRRSNENRSWTLSETFPPLHSADYWLDLDRVGLPGAKPVSSVDIRSPVNASPLHIEAASPDLSGEDRFLLQASADLKLLDVAAFNQEHMKAFASHTVHFTDGTDLSLELISLENGLWARLSGSALGHPQLADNRVFKLDPITASELLPDAS